MTDKQKHFLVTFTATSVVGVATFLLSKLLNTTVLVRIVMALLAGAYLAIGLSVGKEYGDSKATGNTWSWEDILADLLGILASFVAFLLIVLVVWIVKR